MVHIISRLATLTPLVSTQWKRTVGAAAAVENIMLWKEDCAGGDVAAPAPAPPPEPKGPVLIPFRQLKHFSLPGEYS